MMFRALALALLVTAAPAFAGPNDAAQPAATPAAAEAPAATDAARPDPNEKVCKLERQLGSNKMKRVCRTRAQIEIDREAAREALSREQRR